MARCVEDVLQEAAAENMRERARALAKVFWLTHDYGSIGDADVMCELCEALAEAIGKLPLEVEMDGA